MKGKPDEAIESKLDMVGRLLGATRLMDMYLKDASMVEGYVEEFMNGRYHFATIDEWRLTNDDWRIVEVAPLRQLENNCFENDSIP